MAAAREEKESGSDFSSFFFLSLFFGVPYR